MVYNGSSERDVQIYNPFEKMRYLELSAKQGYARAQYTLYQEYDNTYRNNIFNINSHNNFQWRIKADKWQQFAANQGFTSETIWDEVREEEEEKDKLKKAKEEKERAKRREAQQPVRKKLEAVQKSAKEQEKKFNDLLSRANRIVSSFSRQAGQEQTFYELSHHYQYGIGNNASRTMLNNLIEAEKWCRKAFANNGLERIYKAAEMGKKECQFYLGMIYLNGQGGTILDEQKAFEWLSKAAEQNYAPAQSFLGECYMKGNGVSKNLEIAFNWSLKAAEQFYPRSQYILGALWESQKNYKNAYIGFACAVKSNYFDAEYNPQYRLGLLRYSKRPHYARYFSFGCRKKIELPIDDNVTAIEYFDRAAKQGGFRIAAKKAWRETRLRDQSEDYSPREIQELRPWDIQMLFEASRRGDTSRITRMLDCNAKRQYSVNTNTTDENGNTALHYAAKFNKANAVRLLLTHGANANALNRENETPLIAAINHFSTIMNPLETVRALCPSTNLDIQDNKGRTAIVLSVLRKLPDVLELLLGASFNAETEINKKQKNKDNYPLFLLAVKGGCEKTITLLSEHKADIFACNNQGENALMVSAYNKFNYLGKILIAMGLPIDSTNSRSTALEIAIVQEHSMHILALFAAKLLFLIANQQIDCPSNETLDNLFIHVGCMTQRDRYGRTLLHISANCGNESFTDYLLSKNDSALIEAVDSNGNSASEVANENSYGVFEYEFNDIGQHQAELTRLAKQEIPELKFLLQLYEKLTPKSTLNSRANSPSFFSSPENDTQNSRGVGSKRKRDEIVTSDEDVTISGDEDAADDSPQPKRRRR